MHFTWRKEGRVSREEEVIQYSPCSSTVSFLRHIRIQGSTAIHPDMTIVIFCQCNIIITLKLNLRNAT